jgi:hypothetical protein
MRKLYLFGVAVVLAALAVGSSSATAQAPGAYTCSGGDIPGGTYTSLTVTGECTFSQQSAEPITVLGNVTVAAGASLDAHAISSSTVTIYGNVMVGKGAIFGIGQYDVGLTDSAIYGNVIADQPQSLYIGGTTIHGNLVSNGGSGPGLNFPIKDDVIDGNLILQGWSGFWIGAIRDSVGGNLIFSRNSGTNPDSNEVANSVIGGNLICQGNAPPAQLGDTGQPGSVVHGKAVGECAGLTVGG